MDNPKISIIVPVYKVENYLDKCVESILNQTEKGFELILVDDGSPDNCPKICDKYLLKDSRVKVVHKENGGLSDARNAGIKEAIGEWLSFIDSDDFIAPDMIENLLSNAENENADIAICDAVLFKDGENPSFTDSTEKKVMDSIGAQGKMINERLFSVNTWNKIYKKSLFDDIVFPKGRLYEDLATTYKLFDKSKKVVYINGKKYAYLQRATSIMGQTGYKMKADKVEIVAEMIDYYKNNGKIDNFFHGIMDYLLNDIYKMASKGNLVSSIEYREKLKELYFSNIDRIKSNKNISKKSKSILKLAVKSPKLLQFLYSKVRRG